MRTTLVAICLLLMVTGCAKLPAPKPVTPDPAGGVPQQQPAAPPPTTPAPVATAPASIESLLPVSAPLPEGLRRVELDAGQPVSHAGLYFMDVATGKLDAWLPPVSETGMPSIALSSSDDERWIMASDEKNGWLIRRSDGAAFRYDRSQLHVAVGPGVLLARPLQWQNGGAGATCAMLNTEAKLLSTLALGSRCRADLLALFSPDGKTVAISDWDGGPSVTLVTAATGAVKELGPLTLPAGQQVTTTRLSMLRSTGELVLELVLGDRGAPATPTGSLVQIYSWDGRMRSEQRVAGSSAGLSPDGKLISYTVNLDNRLGQATVIQEWGAEQPRFRVAGGLATQWLADGSSVLMNTFRGYRLVSAAGKMTVAPGADGETFRPFDSLIPAPDNADRFLYAGVVLDRSGKTVREVRPADAKDLRIRSAIWGTTAASFHFLALPNYGKGWDADFWFYITPKVQRLPYPDKYPLQVEDPAGECLNLRTQGAEGAKVVRCLPTGTKLALTLQENGEPEVRYEGQWAWLGVKTEQGEQGFVAINTKSVAYAEK
ncbi:MAG TPA: hypothetical protein VD973_29200 [Symbiobacteriaceae bacterium]|nr:hypothetical protein [Symbiobacteriaceae bacterium]